MTTMIQGDELRTILLGRKVEKAAAALPQTAAGALFTVSGGRVIVTSIVGQVTTAIQAQANATKLQSNPTTGDTNDLCGTLDINGDTVGTLYGIVGPQATAMVGGGAGSALLPTNPPVVGIGQIELNCAASNTGQVRWTLTYVPLDDGATVVAA